MDMLLFFVCSVGGEALDAETILAFREICCEEASVAEHAVG